MKILTLLTAISALFIVSCSHYVTPGGPADMSNITDSSISDSFAARPAAVRPARIAIVRVQESGYRSHSYDGVGSGAYSVITKSDVETPEMLDKINNTSGVTGVVRLNSLLLPNRFQSTKELREAAAKLRTDMVLLYTLDTKFNRDDKSVPISVISLGLSPTQKYRVSTTASALLLDTRTGFIYGALEEQSVSNGFATGWGVSSAMDQSRADTEQKALGQLVDSFSGFYRRVH